MNPATNPRHVQFLASKDYRALGLDTGQGRAFLGPKPRSPRRGALRRTSFGSMAPSLMELFGFEASLLSQIAEELAPRCSNCEQVAGRSLSIEEIKLPGEGFLLAAVPDEDTHTSIRERCELLGAERVLVRERVIRLEDVNDDDTGEPIVVLMSASHHDEFRQLVLQWFQRGAASLTIVHLTERDGPIRTLAVVDSGWRCPDCGIGYPKVHKAELCDSAPCARCKGQGWVEIQDGLLHACADCCGFGSLTPQSRYEWSGVEFRYIAGLSLNFVRTMLTQPIPVLDALCDNGFGHYPLGCPVGEFTPGERALASLVSAQISLNSEIVCAVDGGILGGPLPLHCAVNGILCYPDRLTEAEPLIRPSRGRIILRDIESGPLRLAELAIPRGTSTAVQSDGTFVAALVLRDISASFRKRRKLAQRCSFGDLKECYLLDPLEDTPFFVGELLGVGQSIAEEMSRTRGARERGLEPRDFDLEHSRLRCSACLSPQPAGTCHQCGDSRLDGLAGSVTFGGVAYSEIVCTPLERVAEMLWRDESVSEAIRGLPTDLARELTLATLTTHLSEPDRRAVYLLSRLSRLACHAPARGKKALGDSKLVLINLPCSVSTEHQRLVWTGLMKLIDRGATIVCADVPETLETCFSSVLRLRAQPEAGAPDKWRHPRYDVRYNRGVVLEVVR